MIISMKRIQQAGSLAAVPAVIIYASFALAAYLQYPGPFTPAGNWLSDLGNIQQNPAGANTYNLGVLLTGLLVLLAFLGFSQWRLKNSRIQNIMVGATQLFGVLGSLAMVMSAIFPINMVEQHRFWSVSLYIMLGTAFVFSVFALRYRPNIPKWVLVLGIVAALGDILSGIFHEVYLLEWITVLLFLAYLLVLGLITRAISGETSRKPQLATAK